MLDMKFVRENPELVVEAVKRRNGNLDLTEFLELDKKRREITVQVETLKSERNTASQEIGKLKKAGQDASEQMAAVRALGDKIAELSNADLKLIDKALALSMGLLVHYTELEKKLDDKVTYIEKIKVARNTAQDDLEEICKLLGVSNAQSAIEKLQKSS